jgi:Transcriptional regulator/sugar kinase
MQSANTILIKEVNKELVRNYLRQMHSATIHQLSQKTGLSVVTVGSLLAELLESGEVFEGSAVPSNGGRPSALYAYNPNFRLAFVIFGYQKNDNNLMQFCVVNLYGECLEQQEVFISEVLIESFSPYIDEAVQNYPAIGVIGFGLPGSEENGIVLGCDYKNLIGDGFIKYHRDRYKLPVVFINDVNAVAAGFRIAHENLQCITALYFPRIYPPGAGIIIKGQIHAGFRSFAGEWAALPFDVDWLRLNYQDERAVTEAIGKLLAVFCCIVAPEQFVLYGDFFGQESAEQIRAYTQSLLPEYFRVSVCVSESFEKDFELGVIHSSLEQLNDSIVITKKGN